MNTFFARICWNSNQWKHPSGSDGKSSNPDTFENSNGYGNEEWLFNELFCHNGFNYGYLQGLSRSDTHNDKVANVFLWTKKDKGEKQIIGVIYNAIFINSDEAAKVMKVFRKNEVVKIITDDLKKFGINNELIKEAVSYDSFFNLKFKYSDLELFENPINANFITADRYSLIGNVDTVNKYLDALDADIQKIFTSQEKLKPSTRYSEVLLRVRQQEFRQSLIDSQEGCAVTGMKNKKLLIASHIKPWKHSDENERVDQNNGLLLLPNLDKLFDLGFISFDAHGKILISKKLNIHDKDILNINDDLKIRFKINPKMQEYLTWHRKNVFQM